MPALSPPRESGYAAASGKGVHIMAERDERSEASGGTEARPLEEDELDQVAGGKRTNVQDAHDKHANQEINYDKG